MDAIEIIKEALTYPFDNIKNWMLICLIGLLTSVIQVISINSSRSVVNIILHFILIVLIIIISGIFSSIIRQTISGSSEIPMVNPVENLILGIKNLIIELIYLVIPVVITLVISIPFGVFDKFYRIIEASSNATHINSTVDTTANLTNTAVINNIPQYMIREFIISVGLLAILCFILYVIFSALSSISVTILAESDDLFTALNVRTVLSKINSIGWNNYILSIILLILVTIVLVVIAGLISLIPYVGKIIALFIVYAYILTFIARAIGLIYGEG